MATSTVDFDPTEVAIPWKILSEAGIDVRFATDSGKMGSADEHMLKGDYFWHLKKVVNRPRRCARRLRQQCWITMHFKTRYPTKTLMLMIMTG